MLSMKWQEKTFKTWFDKHFATYLGKAASMEMKKAQKWKNINDGSPL